MYASQYNTMPKTFTHLKHILDACVTDKNIKVELAKGGLISSSVTIIGHFIYSQITNNSSIIKIDKKYKFVRNGFTEFMIIDEYGNHYNVNNSIWYFKWNSIEDWCKLKEGDSVNIKYYGVRFPMFGIFPNIYNIYEEKVNHPYGLDPRPSILFPRKNDNL